MSFTTESLTDAPIIVQTHEPGPDVAEEMPMALQQLGELLNIQPDPVYLVINLDGVMLNLDGLLTTSSQAARGPDAVLHHPKVIETLFVVSNNMLKLGVVGLASEAFGSAKVRTFDAYDQALAYCYERIAESAQK
jgi:hypothetical protein